MSGPDEIETLFAKALKTARRREPRRDMSANCFVVIEGNKFRLSNLSPTGFHASGYQGELATNQAFPAEITIRDESFEFVVKAKAAVVRIDKAGLAAKIVTMGRQQRKRIDAYFSHHFPWLKERR